MMALGVALRDFLDGVEMRRKYGENIAICCILFFITYNILKD
jgi:hypothetical protein